MSNGTPSISIFSPLRKSEAECMLHVPSLIARKRRMLYTRHGTLPSVFFNYCRTQWLLLKARHLFGAVAQLGEHHVRNVGVAGSNPARSTTLRLTGYAWHTHAAIGRLAGQCWRSVPDVVGPGETKTGHVSRLYSPNPVASRTNLRRIHRRRVSPHTAQYRPWRLFWSCAFPAKDKTLAFETYLKSHSGKAFAAKRLP